MIDSLRHRFDLPGVTFHLHDRLVVMRLENRHGVAELTPLGATLTSYVPQGGREVIWVSDTARFDGSRPVRGGIPVCWPWFGAHPTDPDQRAHGFARLLPWDIESVTEETESTRAVLRLEPSEETRQQWPHAFVLRLTVTLGPSLRVDLTAENLSPEPWTVSEALHTYLRVGESRDLPIDGLEGCRYWDKQAGGRRGVQEQPLRLAPPFDRVYFAHPREAVIHDGDRRIRIEKAGSSSTVVWNPGPEGARAFDDMPDTAWRQMACVETANALDDAYTLEPDSHHTLTTILSTTSG